MRQPAWVVEYIGWLSVTPSVSPLSNLMLRTLSDQCVKIPVTGRKSKSWDKEFDDSGISLI
jgi:hypothetical protein